MDLEGYLVRIILQDGVRLGALAAVWSLDLPDGWIGAGFVRDRVWDHLHGRPAAPLLGDVDVLWFNPHDVSPESDTLIEAKLRDLQPGLPWSVKNQARMHARNGDAPYASVRDAMKAWPETATAVAVRLDGKGRLAVNAPFGLDDLFGLCLRPTATFVQRKRAIFDQRAATKQWLQRYPLVTLAVP